MKCLVLYSPFSKKGAFKRCIKEIQTAFSKDYESIDFIQTKCCGHATALAKDACGTYDLILVAGGDGLLNEVVAGVAEQPNQPRLAFMASGTVNDSARSLKIPRNTSGALQVAANGIPFRTDIMKYNDHYGFYVIVLGYCAKSIYSTGYKAKKWFGWFAYFVKGVQSFFIHHKMHLKITTDGTNTHEGIYSFVLMYNSHSIAGFPVNPEALLDDGYIDIIMIQDHGKGIFHWFQNVFQVIKLFVLGAKRLKPNKHTVIQKVKSVDIINYDNAVYNVDGNYGGNNDIHLTVLKQAVEIMIPNKTKK